MKCILKDAKEAISDSESPVFGRLLSDVEGVTYEARMSVFSHHNRYVMESLGWVCSGELLFNRYFINVDVVEPPIPSDSDLGVGDFTSSFSDPVTIKGGNVVEKSNGYQSYTPVKVKRSTRVYDILGVSDDKAVQAGPDKPTIGDRTLYHVKVWSTKSNCEVLIDVYDMVDALNLPNFEAIHTFKKLWNAGNRSGGKGLLEDMIEARNQLDMSIARIERKEVAGE